MHKQKFFESGDCEAGTCYVNMDPQVIRCVDARVSALEFTPTWAHLPPKQVYAGDEGPTLRKDRSVFLTCWLVPALSLSGYLYIYISSSLSVYQASSLCPCLCQSIYPCHSVSV